MEAAAALRPSVGVCCGSVKSGFLSMHVAPDSFRFRSNSPFSASRIKLHPSVSHVKSGNQRVAFRSARCNSIRASLSPSESGDSDVPIAPLQFESPIGQFLSQILMNHPHLVPAAVDQQLQQLQKDDDADKQKDEPSVSGTDLVLYRRIAEVKAKERKTALEEILYALVVQKFMDAGVPLIPAITSPSSDSSGQVDIWPGKDEQLVCLHSPEAYEMIQNHLSLILGNRMGEGDIQISKFKVGQLYAASVMFGYFLKRVDQRFQLEKNIKVLPEGVDREGSDTLQVTGEELRSDDSYNAPLSSTQSHPEVESFSAGDVSPGGFGNGIKPSRLRSYVMALDAETLQRYANIRSKEAIGMIEKHTEALFGRPEIGITPQGTIDTSKDEVIKISFSGLKRLVMEAVTLGSFLWDVESYVDSRYHFVTQ
nr:UV-B-induced protein At3g17800, chloroplastic-like [Ipomoea batatas]GMD74545.1 UV-B-induced protein At3g17800, chloroplastic-like [Ipomoea batatas]